jgi:hypothetical protein
MRLFVSSLLLFLSCSIGFSAIGLSNSFIVSLAVFLFFFALLLPSFNRFFSNYSSSVISALSVAFLISLSVYYNSFVVSLLFSLGPLLLGLVLVLVFILIVSSIKSNNLRVLLVILSFVLIGLFLYLNGFVTPMSFSLSSSLSNNWFFDNLGLFLVGLVFVLLYLLLLKMVFFH